MIKIYNTLNQKKEIFKPRIDRKINLFVCGPTVYDLPHLGHAKTYLAFDLIAKYLRESGFRVFYLQNITNIDDKIIKKANEKGIDPQELARDFEKEYLKEMKELKINSVTKYARATNYIKEIINQINRLLKKGYAYKIKDGIYYDISKFKDYGKLAKRTISQAEDGVSRIDEAKEKRNKGDFCLWKFSKPKEPKWKSPFGWGRPGWHIEDTAITEKHFGPQYDIHGGGRDLIFPHHEAEIAQMEAISNKKPMVKFWLHTGLLTVNGQKMSKSLKNFITIRNFLKENNARVLRFFFIKNSYRSNVDYNEKSISQTKKELQKIDEFIRRLKEKNFPNSKGIYVKKIIEETKKEIKNSMDDDFNTPKVIATLFNFINKGNKLLDKKNVSKNEAKQILIFLKGIDKFLGFIFWTNKKEKIPENILILAKKREKFRQEKKWDKADKIRKEIENLGFKLEDTKNGTEIKKIILY